MVGVCLAGGWVNLQLGRMLLQCFIQNYKLIMEISTCFTKRRTQNKVNKLFKKSLRKDCYTLTVEICILLTKNDKRSSHYAILYNCTLRKFHKYFINNLKSIYNVYLEIFILFQGTNVWHHLKMKIRCLIQIQCF